jgi:hypothetical protein
MVALTKLKPTSVLAASYMGGLHNYLTNITYPASHSEGRNCAGGEVAGMSINWGSWNNLSLCVLAS